MELKLLINFIYVGYMNIPKQQNIKIKNLNKLLSVYYTNTFAIYNL